MPAEITATADSQARLPRRRTRRWLLRLLSVIITVGLLAWLLSKVEWARFGQMVAALPPLALFGAFLAYGAQNFFRAVRFRILLQRPDLRLSVLLPITFYHNFLVRVLPFKLGEVAYVVLLRTRLGYAVGEGISSLFGARLLELMMIILMTALGLLFAGGAGQQQAGTFVALVPIVLILCGLLLYYAGALLRGLRRVLIGIGGETRAKWWRGLLHQLASLAASLDTLRQPRLFVAAFLTSFFSYGSAFILNTLMLTAVGVEVSLPLLVLIISFGQFAISFPFSVSGFGVVEGGWALGLVLFAGFATSDAVAVGFLLHGFQVISASIYGLLGYLWLSRRQSEVAH